MFTGRTTMKVYDFKQSVADPIAEFSFYGHAMGMNENYIVIAVKRVSSHDVNVLDWQKVCRPLISCFGSPILTFPY